MNLWSKGLPFFLLWRILHNIAYHSFNSIWCSNPWERKRGIIQRKLSYTVNNTIARFAFRMRFIGILIEIFQFSHGIQFNIQYLSFHAHIPLNTIAYCIPSIILLNTEHWTPSRERVSFEFWRLPIANNPLKCIWIVWDMQYNIWMCEDHFARCKRIAETERDAIGWRALWKEYNLPFLNRINEKVIGCKAEIV